MTPFVARPYRSIVVNRGRSSLRSGSVDEFARVLGTDPWVVAGVLPQVGRRLGGRIVEAGVIDGEIQVRTASMDQHVPWSRRLSGAEQAALFYELAIAIADLQSEVEPTLLAFDGALRDADSHTRQHLLNLMSSAGRSFQSVVLHEHPLPEASQEWTLTYLTTP